MDNIKYLKISLLFLLLSGILLLLSGFFNRCEYKYYECFYNQCMFDYKGTLLLMNHSDNIYILDKPCQNVGLFNNLLFILSIIFLSISFYPIFRIIENKEVEK